MVFGNLYKNIASALVCASLSGFSGAPALAQDVKPLERLFEHIDNTPGPDQTYQNCQSFQSLATAGSSTFLCDFTAQTSWYNTASDLIAADSGGGAWKQKVVVTVPKGFSGGTSDYFYLGAGGDDAEFYYGLFHDVLEQVITLPPINADMSQLDSLLKSNCPPAASENDCIMLNLGSLVSFAMNVPAIIQLDIPYQPLDIKSPINGKYYSRHEDDLIAETIMYPGTHLSDIEDYMDYVVLMPMASSLVHGMEAGLNSVGMIPELSGLPLVERYVLGGASKRAWALYLALAYDANFTHMVKAALPLVMPFDLEPVLSRIHQNYYFDSQYRGWSDELQPYEQDTKHGTGPRNILDSIVSGDYREWEAQVDIGPYLAENPNFLRGFPILEVAASHDAYFTPAAPETFMYDFWALDYNKYATLIMLPNVGHGGISPSAFPGLVAPALEIIGFVVDATGIPGNVLGYAPNYSYANLFEAQLMHFARGDAFFIETSVKPAVIPGRDSEVYYRCTYAQEKTDLLDASMTTYSDAQYFTDVSFTHPDFLTWRWMPSMNDLFGQMTACNGNPNAPYLAYFVGVTFPEPVADELIGTHYRESPIYVIENPNR